MQRQRSLVYSILSDLDIFLQSVTQDRDYFFRSRNTFLLSAGETLLKNSGNTFCAVCMAMSLSMYAAQFREMLEHQNGRYQRKMQGGFSGN